MAVKKLTKKAAPSKKAAPKKAAKKAPAKKAAVKSKVKAPAKKKAKAAPKAKSERKPNAQFIAPLTPSPALAEVIGAKPLPRTEAVKKIWAYIKKNGLQDKQNKRAINADAKLKAVIRKDQVSMFDLAKILAKNLS